VRGRGRIVNAVNHTCWPLCSLTLSCRRVVCRSAGARCCLPIPADTGQYHRFGKCRPTDLLSWGVIWRCVLYIGLQIFTLWQKIKSWVRIIFNGVLYSKFYGIFNFCFKHSAQLYVGRSIRYSPQKIAMLRSATFAQLSCFLTTAQFLTLSATFVQLWLILGCFGTDNVPFLRNFCGQIGTFEHP